MSKTLLILALSTVFAAQAGATILSFDASLDLTGTQEAPPNASPASGNGTITYDTSTYLFEVDLSWSDLLAPVTAAHIHIGAGPGTNGPVALTFVGISNASSGTYSHVFDLDDAATYSASFLAGAGGTAAGARAALLAQLDAGHGYFNIHTSVYPGGEIRGDISPVVPEPASLALVGLGAAATVLRRRRSGK